MQGKPLVFDVAAIREACESRLPYPAGLGDFLKYLPAGKIGYSKIAKNALLIPESIALMISPSGCSRHCSCNALFAGEGQRFFSLRLNEVDIASGLFPAKIEAALAEIFRGLGYTPKAAVLISTCVDALAGTDYGAYTKSWSEKFSTRVTRLAMNPILEDSPSPHKIETIRTLYGFIAPQPQLPRMPLINVLGRVAAVSPASELGEIAGKYGGCQLRHISQCRSLAEFDEMGRARLNITIPIGESAGKDMEKKYGIPYVVLRPSYHPDTVADNYRRLGEALGTTIDDGEYYQSVKELAARTAGKYGRWRGAVGESIDDQPLVLARDLLDMGFDIRYVFIEKIRPGDLPALRWLEQNAPGLRVLISAHPSMAGFSLTSDDIDYAVGLLKSFYWRAPDIPVVDVDEQPFDYFGIRSLLTALATALEAKKGD
ncbi:MAG: nitrogenase component 1 [Peptococcaceae bacterium]|jgi:nitrogenase molybdenum-cofactor synthesis protein NifE|nr:nitrogenase component 1 [Peptococcaceae bacterium]